MARRATRERVHFKTKQQEGSPGMTFAPSPWLAQLAQAHYVWNAEEERGGQQQRNLKAHLVLRLERKT